MPCYKFLTKSQFSLNLRWQARRSTRQQLITGCADNRNGNFWSHAHRAEDVQLSPFTHVTSVNQQVGLVDDSDPIVVRVIGCNDDAVGLLYRSVQVSY